MSLSWALLGHSVYFKCFLLDCFASGGHPLPLILHWGCWGTPECLPLSYCPEAVSWGRVLTPSCLPGVGH